MTELPDRRLKQEQCWGTAIMTELPDRRLKQELIYETSSSVPSKFPFMAEIMKLEANYYNPSNVDMKREDICGQIKLEPDHDTNHDVTDHWTSPAEIVDTKPVNSGQYQLPYVCGETPGLLSEDMCVLSQDQSVPEMVFKQEPTLLTYDICGDLSATESTVMFEDCAVSNNSLQSIFVTLVAYEGASQHESQANEMCLVAGNTDSHGDEIAYLSICNEQNMNSDSPHKTHTRADIDKEFHTCNVCNLQFTERHLLKVHMTNHTKKKLYKCDICNVTFTKKCQFTKHLEVHTSAYPYICNICSTSYQYEKDLKIHNKLHAGQYTYKCDICGKGFIWYNSLRVHIGVHTGDKPYLCGVCNARFVYVTDLRRHRKIHTGVRPYTCDVCRKGFTRKCHLKRHIRMHTGEKPFKCAVCSTRFTRAFGLNIHMRKHTGVMPYKCDVCNAGFTCNAFLKQHAKIHVGEKLYKCAGSGCARVTGFKMHEHVHKHRINGYACDMCNLKFSYIHDIIKHLCVHSGEKLYKCDVCNKRFSCICNIIKHMYAHTGKKPFTCVSCRMIFPYKYLLLEHRKCYIVDQVVKCV